jgi:hypothetical protein
VISEPENARTKRYCDPFLDERWAAGKVKLPISSCVALHDAEQFLPERRNITKALLDLSVSAGCGDLGKFIICLRNTVLAYDLGKSRFKEERDCI